MAKRSVVHVEIPANNREETADFYKALCDWDFQHMTEPSPYTTFEAGNTAGGYTNLGDPFPQPNNVVVYLSSDDIDADLKRVEELGGKTLMPKMAIGPNAEHGWIAWFADPTGNTLAFWSRS